MIPLRDSERRLVFPAVTLILIGINVAVFVYQLGLGQRGQISLWAQWGVIPLRVSNLGAVSANGQVIASLFTSQFLHANWLHILANMWYLWIFGDNIESRLGGRVRYLLLYLGSGAVGALAHSMVHPDSIVPTIGASGAVAGVLGAYLVLFPRARILTILPLGFFITLHEVPAVLFLFVWIGLQVVNGLSALGATAAQPVAWWAHIGGFASGMVMVALLSRPTRSPQPLGPSGPVPARVMALDLGERRIGVAVSDLLGITAQPVGHIEKRGLEKDLERLDALIREYEVDEVVVGLPLHMHGEEGNMATRAREFGEIVSRRWGLPVAMWDERLSTVHAERLLLEGDLSRRRRRQLIDALAAAVFLQSYLDRKRAPLGE